MAGTTKEFKVISRRRIVKAPKTHGKITIAQARKAVKSVLSKGNGKEGV